MAESKMQRGAKEENEYNERLAEHDKGIKEMTNKPDVIKAALSVGKPKGGYCSMCDTVWVEPKICNCSATDRLNKDTMNVYKREIYNEAIEEVIKALIDKTHVTNEIKILIRKLKK